MNRFDIKLPSRMDTETVLETAAQDIGMGSIVVMTQNGVEPMVSEDQEAYGQTKAVAREGSKVRIVKIKAKK